MKTLRTMMMVTLTALAMTTATASNNARNGERGRDALQNRMEQRSTSRHDQGRAGAACHHDKDARGKDKNARCVVCHKRDCKVHNYCPTCGKSLKKQTLSFGHRNATFGGRR